MLILTPRNGMMCSSCLITESNDFHAIVRDLALRGAPVDDNGVCRLCREQVDGDTVARHAPECTYRRAVEMVR